MLFILAITILLSVGVAQAEPIAQMPLSEFKQMIVREEKKDKIIEQQGTLIKIKDEKDKKQTDYIAKIEEANETIQTYASKVEEVNAQLRQVNAQLAAENKDKQLSTLAEGAGYGATAAAVLGVVVRKLILKF